MEKEHPVAPQLLFAFLDLLSYEKDLNKWSEEEFSDNPPRLYRLQIVNALMKALNLTCSYADFLKGEFITEENLPSTTALRQQLALICEYLSIKSNSTWSVTKAKFVFDNLIQYRLRLLNLFDFGSGVIASSGYYRVPFLVSTTFNDKLKEPIENLNQLIVLFFNSEKLYYSKATLIEKFGFPDVDLREVDMDWF